MGDPRFKHLEVKVGIFVVVAIIAIVGTIVAVGISRDIFVKKVYVKLFTQTGEEVSKGMQVKYSGFPISRVDNVQLQDDGLVVMTIGIPTRYSKWIRQNSVFKLSSLNIIGSGYIMISTDLQSNSPIVVNGSEFTLVRDQGIQALVDQAIPVIEDVKEIVGNINIILARVADEKGDVSKLLKGMGALGEDISNKEGSLGFLARSDYVQDEIKFFLRDLRQFSESAVRIADNVEKGSVTLNSTLTNIDSKAEPILDNTLMTIEDIDKVAQMLIPIVEKLDNVLVQLEEASKNAADGTKNLDELRAEIQSVVQNGNKLLLQLQNLWPFTSDKPPRVVPLK